jgi:hypothetical protein
MFVESIKAKIVFVCVFNKNGAVWSGLFSEAHVTEA